MDKWTNGQKDKWSRNFSDKKDAKKSYLNNHPHHAGDRDERDFMGKRWIRGLAPGHFASYTGVEWCLLSL